MRRSNRSLYLSAFIAFALMSLLAACGNPSATTGSTQPSFTTTPSANSTNSSTVTPPTQVPATQAPATQAPTTQTSSQVSPAQASQAAQDTVQQYYDDLNDQSYQDAYNIWLNNQQTFSQWKQGFSNTYHDDLTLGNTVVNSDGSVQVNLSLVSYTSSGVGMESHGNYQGYYIVQQQSDGSWKFTTADLQSGS
jgi:hypothetical protein